MKRILIALVLAGFMTDGYAAETVPTIKLGSTKNLFIYCESKGAKTQIFSADKSLGSVSGNANISVKDYYAVPGANAIDLKFSEKTGPQNVDVKLIEIENFAEKNEKQTVLHEFVLTDSQLKNADSYKINFLIDAPAEPK